ncbi:MAG: hypothetical protein KUG79_01300 [Pseudomonadales bacterium]|nr:hypothetical protein [Pseudomonadales bacterium]
MSNRITTIIGVSFILLATTLSAGNKSAENKVGISDDGREVQLNQDGSWEYISQDRFATTTDGKRVRLKPNGEWQPIKQTEAIQYRQAQRRAFSRDALVVEESSVTLELSQIVIESWREKVHKGKRIKSQILFYVEVTAEDNNAQQWDFNDLGAFSASDNRDRDYPILSVSPASLSMTGKNTQKLVISAHGAPRWWGLKSMQLTIRAGTFNNTKPLILSKIMSEVVIKEVEQLSE